MNATYIQVSGKQVSSCRAHLDFAAVILSKSTVAATDMRRAIGLT